MSLSVLTFQSRDLLCNSDFKLISTNIVVPSRKVTSHLVYKEMVEANAVNKGTNVQLKAKCFGYFSHANYHVDVVACSHFKCLQFFFLKISIYAFALCLEMSGWIN
jgi:hypothetical protein